MYADPSSVKLPNLVVSGFILKAVVIDFSFQNI